MVACFSPCLIEGSLLLIKLKAREPQTTNYKPQTGKTGRLTFVSGNEPADKFGIPTAMPEIAAPVAPGIKTVAVFRELLFVRVMGSDANDCIVFFRALPFSPGK